MVIEYTSRLFHSGLHNRKQHTWNRHHPHKCVFALHATSCVMLYQFSQLREGLGLLLESGKEGLQNSGIPRFSSRRRLRAGDTLARTTLLHTLDQIKIVAER